MSYPNVHAEIKSIHFTFTGIKTIGFIFDDIYICKCDATKNINYTASLYESNADDEILSFELLLIKKDEEKRSYDILENLIKSGKQPDYIEISMFNNDLIVYDLFQKDYIITTERTPYLDLCISVYKKGYENDYKLPMFFNHDECVEKIKCKASYLNHVLYEDESCDVADLDCEEF